MAGHSINMNYGKNNDGDKISFTGFDHYMAIYREANPKKKEITRAEFVALFNIVKELEDE